MTDAQSIRIDAIFHSIDLSQTLPHNVGHGETAIRLEHEWSDKPDYTSVKIVDPDGYVVEMAFDAILYGVIAYRVDRANRRPTFPQNLTVVICETRSPVYSYPTIGHRSGGGRR